MKWQQVFFVSLLFKNVRKEGALVWYCGLWGGDHRRRVFVPGNMVHIKTYSCYSVGSEKRNCHRATLACAYNSLIVVFGKRESQNLQENLTPFLLISNLTTMYLQQSHSSLCLQKTQKLKSIRWIVLRCCWHKILFLPTNDFPHPLHCIVSGDLLQLQATS